MPKSFEQPLTQEREPLYLFIADASGSEQGPFTLVIDEDGGLDVTNIPINVRRFISTIALDAFGRGSIPVSDGQAFISALLHLAEHNPYIRVRSSPSLLKSI